MISQSKLFADWERDAMKNITCPHCDSDRVDLTRYGEMCLCRCAMCGKRWTELRPTRRVAPVQGRTDWVRGLSNDGVTPLTGGMWQ